MARHRDTLEKKLVRLAIALVFSFGWAAILLR